MIDGGVAHKIAPHVLPAKFTLEDQGPIGQAAAKARCFPLLAQRNSRSDRDPTLGLGAILSLHDAGITTGRRGHPDLGMPIIRIAPAAAFEQTM